MRTAIAKITTVLILIGLHFHLRHADSRADDPPKPPAIAHTAEKLVQAALQAEVAGQNGERQELLSQALSVDTGHALARWQAGYVQHDGRWQTVQQVAATAANDPIRQQYSELRAKTADDAPGQLKLAKWCRDHKLPDAANAHLMRALVHEPDNAQARAQLGFRRFRGGWATEQEVAAYQESERQQKQVEAKWKPKLESIRRRLADPSEKVQQAAKDELRAINDPKAIGLVLRHFAGANKEIDNMLVDVFSHFKGEKGVQALLRVAVLSEFPSARMAAADHLKKVELDSYAPLLLSGMFKPITTRDELRHTGHGIYLWRRTIECEGQFDTNKSVDDGLVVSYVDGAQPGKSDRRKVLTARRGLSDEQLAKMPRVDDPRRAIVIQNTAASGEATHRQDMAIEEQNRQVLEQNQRIAAVLNQVTEQHLSPLPEVWWKWWNDRYETTTVSKHAQATYNVRIVILVPKLTYDPQFFSVANGGTALMRRECDGLQSTGSMGPVGLPGGGGAPPGASNNWSSNRTPGPTMTAQVYTCFVAGTSVWTQDGQRRIEKIRLGDLVLSQNAATGEVAYKTVLQTTVRPAVPLTKLSAGDETILCTPGHPFWVNGRGWTMAKELAAGYYLHGRSGAVPLWELADAPQAKTYNLVVAEFHSYFVGQAGLLVHDNGIWEPTDAPVPGMATSK